MYVLVLMSLSLVLAGCSGVGGDALSGAADAKTGAFKVAMLLPGPVDDQAWSKAGYDGLQLVAQELGAEVAFTASVPEDDIEKEKLLRQYAEAGFDLIIGHGGNYISAVVAVVEGS